MAGVWSAAALAQAPGPTVNVAPPWPGARADAARALRGLMKKYSQENRDNPSAACSIPLKEVPVAKAAPPMRIYRRRAAPENVDRMPFVPLPAPPCQEAQH